MSFALGMASKAVYEGSIDRRESSVKAGKPCSTALIVTSTIVTKNIGASVQEGAGTFFFLFFFLDMMHHPGGRASIGRREKFKERFLSRL